VLAKHWSVRLAGHLDVTTRTVRLLLVGFSNSKTYKHKRESRSLHGSGMTKGNQPLNVNGTDT